jgi:hypothetical protein
MAVFSDEEAELGALTYARLASPQHRGETEDIAAAQVVLLTQCIRMRVALLRLADDAFFNNKKDMRKFAASALEYADSFTREDVLASYKRIAKPEEH